MEWFKKIFKKNDIKDIDDDLINLGTIEDDSVFVADDQVVDREPQKIRKNWLRDWMIWGVVFFIAGIIIYLDVRDFKLKIPKKNETVKKENFKPVELDWQSQIVKEIEQKKAEIEHETAKIETTFETHEIEKKQQEKKKRKKEKYGEFKRYGFLLNDKKNKSEQKHTSNRNRRNYAVYINSDDGYIDENKIAEQTRKEIENRGGRGDGFDRNAYMKTIMSGINGSKEETKTLNEKLNVKPLKKVYAALDTDLDYQLFKGTKISAILNEHMSTDLGGFISAVIDHDVYSSNGEKLIIPAGSIATGRYASGLKKGVRLVFTVWEDIRTKCGANINLKSPGTSPMGLPGQQIEIDHHFVERFGSSLMLSLVNAVVSTAGGFATQGNTQTISDIQNNLNKSSEIALQDSIGIKPTGYAEAGQSITIMVARNLNFKNVFKNGEPICE